MIEPFQLWCWGCEVCGKTEIMGLIASTAKDADVLKCACGHTQSVRLPENDGDPADLLRAQLAEVTKERDVLLALVEKAKSALMTQMLQYDDDDAKRLYSLLADDGAYD